MKTRIASQCHHQPKGFALVVTLTLMILLTVIAVGLLTLSSISLRHSSRAMLEQEARQNARLALMIAIGELQSSTGPDQRITATAGVTTTAPARPHLTGVWEGWKWDGAGPVPNFDNEKTDRFVRWLVSSPEVTDTESPDYPATAITGNRVSLVNGITDPLDEVGASVIPIAGGGSDPQGFAWAVFDESQKIPTALPEPEGNSLAILQNRMAAAPLPGYASATSRNWGPLGNMANHRLKLVTPEQSALAKLSPEDRRFHDLTSRTAGLAADVAKGGLAADMSRIFDQGAINGDYEDRYLYSETDSPLVPSPSRFSGANPFPSPDPSWRLLHSHYRAFDRMSGGTSPILNTTTMARPAAGTTGQLAQENPFFHNQQILPVISKAQFVFSLSFGYHAALSGATNPSLPAAQKDYYVTWLVIDPVITLWNPYNVTMRYTGGRIDLYRIPMGFRLYKNGTLINSEYTHLANTFLSGSDMNNRKDTFYRLNLLPVEGESDITLAPGEHVVLTASNHVKHYQHEYMTKGLDLRPGFSPPAGNASANSVGGTSTLNVCVSSNGNPNGNDYNKSVRTVAVKAGDQIQVEVKPLHANIDKPKETGGKEISGFLKYYAGPPNSPRLVGGIELDYGNQESTYLETFSRNEMPNLVVSSAIPKNVQADDYQGNKPPVAVRFKEPFLISTFQLKTERDSKFPSRGWLENSPINAYASAGLDQTEPWEAQQYEFQWEAMTDWPPSSPTIEISNTGNRGYGGPGIYAQSGLEFATHSTLPLEPALSIPQLRHAPLNTGGQLPLVSQIVGNSFQPPQMNPSDVRSTAGNRTFLDHSYFANNALFDSHFFSGLANAGGPLPNNSGDAKSKLTAFLDQGKPLPNPRFIAWPGGNTTQEITDQISATDGFRKTASHLLIDSPFNINSTSVDVWEALLASAFGAEVPVSTSGNIAASAGDTTIPVSRHLPSTGADLESQADPVSRDIATWNGYRRLEPSQIRSLAEEIVDQVRERGPFLSLAEFVNRRPGSGELAQSGALQTALEKADINGSALNPGSDLPTIGNTADGAPAVLTQADLLTPIAPILTARGDTFRIRAYGEAGPVNGPKIRVWCEAVVQRLPEYLDPADEPWDDPKLPVNQRFGRRYEQISFRWLAPSEI